jgi:hypothetical protein
LALYFFSGRSEGVAELAGAAHLAGLVDLEIPSGVLTETDARALLASPHLGQLRKLRIPGTWPHQLAGMAGPLMERFGKDVFKRD